MGGEGVSTLRNPSYVYKIVIEPIYSGVKSGKHFVAMNSFLD